MNLSHRDHSFNIKNEDEWELGSGNVQNLVYSQNMLDYNLKLKNLPSRILELKYKVYGDSAVSNVGYSEEEKFS